jgi:hypothetical protein
VTFENDPPRRDPPQPPPERTTRTAPAPRSSDGAQHGIPSSSFRGGTRPQAPRLNSRPPRSATMYPAADSDDEIEEDADDDNESGEPAAGRAGRGGAAACGVPVLRAHGSQARGMGSAAVAHQAGNILNGCQC